MNCKQPLNLKKKQKKNILLNRQNTRLDKNINDMIALFINIFSDDFIHPPIKFIYNNKVDVFNLNIIMANQYEMLEINL